MVGRRHAELGIRTEALVARELLGVAAHRELAHLLVEPLRPVIFRGLIAETGAEVMNDVAAADEKDALVAKRRQYGTRWISSRRLTSYSNGPSKGVNYPA